MAKQMERLNALKVKALAKPGMHADGQGLYLRISEGKNAGKRWVFLYRRPKDGKRCEIGLGGTATVSLAKAREKAAAARDLLGNGQDPKDAKAEDRATPTFHEMTTRYLASMGAAWKNAKHRRQWTATLDQYAASLRDKRVDEITKADVLAVLQPIWQKIPETASRVRGRIEAILDTGKAADHRQGENPAAWRGNLKLILPARRKLTRGHHAAMPIDGLPGFMVDLRAREAVAARCLEFTILTACRSGEALGALWTEVDIDRKVWTIPATRMKSGRPHTVPLTDRALEILAEMQRLGDPIHVFPGQRRGKPLSSMALEMVLRRMKIEDATVHGFRSTFRDWAGNRTNFPRELAEHALAHVIGDKAEQAYRRDDALERRRPMMQAWARFLEGAAAGNVVPIRKAAGLE